jgi:hypothetical protein
MAIKKWVVVSMDCYPQVGNISDVVFHVHWSCTGEQDTYSASLYGICPVPTPSEDAFTPYANLTQDQVLGWIWANGVDQQVIEDQVQQQINNQIMPPVVTYPLPWIGP